MARQDLHVLNYWLLYFNLLLTSVITVSTTTAAVSLHTRQGTIYGRQTQHSNEYLGIQYATADRWKSPADLASVPFPHGSLQATSFGSCCPQSDAGIFIPEQDEQCLYLNVYTPLNVTSRSLLPVLVWIHGGGLQVGCSSQSIPTLYDGTNIIANSPSQQPVLVVTLNYRLGILGDMYLTELLQENPSMWPTAGNYFYLDMLSALRWIQTNIDDYGGNPNNVLLFGESSGANAVIDIGALRGSANLYQHVISQSGGAGHHSYYSNTSDAMTESLKIVQKLNCTNDPSRTNLTCLRNSSVAHLLTAYGARQTKVIVDGYFLPFYPPVAISKGAYNRNISMIVGRNEYESPMCFSSPDMDSASAMAFVVQGVGEKWAPRFINESRISTCSANRNATNRCCDMVRVFFTDFILDCSARRIYNRLYERNYQENLFWYHLDCNPGICPPKSTEEGRGLCFHTSELPYVFGTVSDMYSRDVHNCTWDVESMTFSSRIIAHWISMATVGQPLPEWLNYHPSSPKYLQITPYQDFSTLVSSRNCALFDQFEEEKIDLMFGHSENHGVRTEAHIGMILLLLFMVSADSIRHHF